MISQQVSYTPTISEVVDVYRFHQWGVARTPKFILQYLRALVCMIFVGGVIRWGGKGNLIDAFLEQPRIVWTIWLVTFIGIFVGLPLWRYILAPSQVRRMHPPESIMVSQCNVSWNDEGTTIEFDNGSRTVLSARNVCRWRESGQAFLLYLNDFKFIFVVKRAFISVEQSDSFRTSLRHWAGNGRAAARNGVQQRPPA